MKIPIVDMNSLRKYKKEFNFFETPHAIAKQMAEMINGLGRNARILEPSAGLGRLIKAVMLEFKFPPQIDFCEVQEEFIAVLSECTCVGRDFMEYNPGPIYDAVIMNPPYKNKMAEAHVDHAWECIKPGGWIVAIVDMSAAIYIQDEYCGHIFEQEVIRKGFKETSIDTCLFLINKPLGG